MVEIPEPQGEDRAGLMMAAVAEVKAAKMQLSQQKPQDAADLTRESVRPMEISKVESSLSGQMQELRHKFPDAYTSYLRAAVRALTRGEEQTRRRLYQLLHCAPEEQG